MSRTSEDLLFDLKLVDNLVGSSFAEADMSFYFAGGSACILAGWIDRMSDKDIEDIRLLMVDINIETLEKCIQETLDNIVYADRRGRYELNLVNFRHMFIREIV